MSLMIDWITCKVPFFAVGSISDGCILSIDSFGSIDYTIPKRLSVSGSYSSSLSVKTVDVDQDGNTSVLSISGNPVKWFQGHNVFGSDDLHGLVCSTVHKLSFLLNSIQPSSYTNAIQEGSYSVSRVDINTMFDFDSRGDVLSYIHTVGRTSSTRHGKAVFKGDTVYLGKTSERWSFKFYSKGQEFLVHKPDDSMSDLVFDFLKGYSDTKLRCELTLKQKELKKLNLNIGKSWVVRRDPYDLYMAYIEKINVADMIMNAEKLNDIPRPLRSSYELWNLGKDVRELVSRPTFYRHKKQLLEFGIDISIPKPVAEKPVSATILPFKRVIECRLAVLPEEILVNSDLFFNPKSYLKSF